MAEFCRQCADKHGMANDFDGIVREGYTLGVICEGCGPTFVITDGSCVNAECAEHHGAATALNDEAKSVPTHHKGKST